MTNLQDAKETLRAACPEWMAAVWRPLRSGCRALFHRSKSMESTFFQIYERRAWGDGESVSGFGSDLDQTAAVREALPALLKQIGARTMVDAPCGDFHWMKEVKLELDRYIGIDIVPDLIDRNQQLYTDEVREFRTQNITKEPVPNVDVIFCRDCLGAPLLFRYRESDLELQKEWVCLSAHDYICQLRERTATLSPAIGVH